MSGVGLLAVLAIGGLIYGFAMRADETPATGPVAGGGGNTTTISDEEITEILDDHGRALEEGDLEAFLAPFVGEDVKSEQRDLFDNLRKVSFSETSYALSAKEGRGTDSYGQGASLVVDVAFVHQIEDVDVTPVAEWYSWTVEKPSQDAELKVTKVAGSDRKYLGRGGLVYHPAPWDLYEDMAAIRKDHVLVLADQKKIDHARRLAPLVEQAAEENLAAWEAAGPQEAPAMPGFVVALENDRQSYEKLYRKKKTDSTSEAGVAYALPSRGGSEEDRDIHVGGARIVIDTGSGRFQPHRWPGGPLEISRHEIAHAMIAHTEGHVTDGDTQRWVVEGFGDYMAFREDKATAEAEIAAMKTRIGGSFDGRLPQSATFYAPGDGNPNYTLGYLALRFIAEKGGEDAAFTFVTDHYKKPEKLDAQLRKATGMGTAEFEEAWADYVRKAMA
ncbi:hypothetical protein RM572_08595 [Streptomyces sp. DSM 42041]|uniref:Peptidase MA-like domain-containing protein n=1 Tax=Streptomyces hazeniae TaxID=3075538 RepID=A0ABU2NQU3_9ACTN|nr:hypothetical protein [Streptomyces sp. DSM 42041]MDT0378832.1 hypothetical protein [Streptomyces sp. DSM 42041]